MGELPSSVRATPPRNLYSQTVTSPRFQETALADSNKKFDNKTPRQVSRCLPSAYLKLQQKFWKCADPGLVPLNFSEYAGYWRET
jgi:hypothetical protein